MPAAMSWETNALRQRLTEVIQENLAVGERTSDAAKRTLTDTIEAELKDAIELERIPPPRAAFRSGFISPSLV